MFSYLMMLSGLLRMTTVTSRLVGSLVVVTIAERFVGRRGEFTLKSRIG